MANNKNVKEQKAVAETTETTAEVKRGKKKPVIIISSVLLTLALIGTIIAVALGSGFDYEKKNISRYISFLYEKMSKN